MLRLLRRSRRIDVPLAVGLAAYVFLGTADWWHSWDDDQGDQAAVLHNHAAHRPLLASKGPVGTADHCFICHWLRSLQNGFGRGNLHDLPTAEGRGWHSDAALLPNLSAAAQIPARAPPA